MKSDDTDITASGEDSLQSGFNGQTHIRMQSNISESLDSLIEYLVDNNIDGIHPLIMGEIEKRLIIKVLERSRGNKLRAAKSLGMSRNTFHRKMLRILENDELNDLDS